MKNKGSFRLTFILCIVLFLIISLNWSLFISGPSRIQEEKNEKILSKI